MDIRATNVTARSGGFTLIETMVVLALLGIIAVVGVLSLAHSLGRQEARGATQIWQAAAGRTQVGVMWLGGGAELASSEGSLSITHDGALFGGTGVAQAPDVAVNVNLARWLRDGGTCVSFTGRLASPDGGGSLYFASAAGSYRVVVRPETGFTVRSWVGP